jgi:hypothetical protein
VREQPCERRGDLPESQQLDEGIDTHLEEASNRLRSVGATTPSFGMMSGATLASNQSLPILEFLAKEPNLVSNGEDNDEPN